MDNRLQKVRMIHPKPFTVDITYNLIPFTFYLTPYERGILK